VQLTLFSINSQNPIHFKRKVVSKGKWHWVVVGVLMGVCVWGGGCFGQVFLKIDVALYTTIDLKQRNFTFQQPKLEILVVDN
jgi:hypothetical protein